MKNIKSIWILTVLLFFISSSLLRPQQSVTHLTGNLHADSKMLFDYSAAKTNTIAFDSPDKKSPLIAGLLSAVLPGVGEFYTESYLKAAIFTAVEVGVISVAIAYNKKGDSQTSTFQQYADGHWSVERYANWTIEYAKHKYPTMDVALIDNVKNSDGTVNWNGLNALERAMGSGGYSHALPMHGDQQYYELIGKYPQYSGGWDDKAVWDSDHPEINDYHDLSPRFYDYSKMRGKANDYYNISDKAVLAIYVNHLLSGLDAVWSAISFNKDLAVNIRVNPIHSGANVTLYPTINVRYGF
ncbi:MAG: hypothetical protein Q8N83_08515 [Ignavibacteria bacterium]|nr:hypothetical protein [Ignavibacteria bacterium]